jgi:hypothetical protein
VVEDRYMVRDLDELPQVFSAEELGQGFEDATTKLSHIGRDHGHTTAVGRLPVALDAHQRAD